MSLTNRRRLPNVNSQKQRLVSPVLPNAQHEIRDVQSTMSPVENVRNKSRRISPAKQQLNDREANELSKQDAIIHEVQLHFDRRLQDIKRKVNTSTYHDEEKTSQVHIESNKHRNELPLQNTRRSFEGMELKSQQVLKHSMMNESNPAILREHAKSIRESVTQYKNDLMRNEAPKNEELYSLLTRRRRPEQDQRQIENEYLIHQQSTLSRSAVINEMLSFKKELEQTERQREQLSDRLESVMKTSDEKEKLISKTSMELKDMTENCETFERQNSKLHQDLNLALEKLEEMTEEAERFAQESGNSQKQLADSEQKREEFQIQAQETIKQWTARVKKLEKDIERYKLDSTQMSEKQEQLTKENETLTSQNSALKDQNTQIQTDLNETNVNYKRLEEQFHQHENNIIHLRSLQSSQDVENTTLKERMNELERQLSIQGQRLSRADKEKENLEELLQEEILRRKNFQSKLKQTEQNIETLNTSCSQLQNERKNLSQKLNDIQMEKDTLVQEKSRYLAMENDYEELRRKLETTKMDYTRGMKALQMDYENKLQLIQMQLTEEKNQNAVLQRHEVERKKEFDKLQEKFAKYEDENTEQQSTIDILSREINDKSRSIEELQFKISKLTNEITNQTNEILQNDKDYQNSIESIYDTILYCTECLSTDSSKPFIIEPSSISRDDTEVYSSKLKAHLAWLKQELEIRRGQESKLREDLNNALLDCETDRKYFASELTKREVIIQQLTDHRTYPDTITEYDQQKFLATDQRDRIDHGYRQIQTMIDSVKRELHTAKVQLLA